MWINEQILQKKESTTEVLHKINQTVEQKFSSRLTEQTAFFNTESINITLLLAGLVIRVLELQLAQTRAAGSRFKDPAPGQQTEVLTALIQTDLQACRRRRSQQRRQLKLQRNDAVWDPAPEPLWCLSRWSSQHASDWLRWSARLDQLLWGSSACRGPSSSRLLQLGPPRLQTNVVHKQRGRMNFVWRINSHFIMNLAPKFLSDRFYLFKIKQAQRRLKNFK